MPSAQDATDPGSVVPSDTAFARKGVFASLRQLPLNVYLLLFFTLGKGFQITIALVTLNYYAYSLGYQADFIGYFSAAPALGSLLCAVPVGMLADRLGRKPVLLVSAFLTPLFLALTGLLTSAPLLLICGVLQGASASAYWVTNLPLLAESTNEQQRVGVLALNSFLLLGVGALGSLLGGFIPEIVGHILHVPANSTVPLRIGVLTAALFTVVFSLPLWLLHEPKRSFVRKSAAQLSVATPERKSIPVLLFAQLLIPDILFNIGEGAVVALMQIYFVLRFGLSPGTLGLIFTVSGLAGGIFSLTAPLFVRRWGKLNIITTLQYLSAPLFILIGLAPLLPLAVIGEYTRSFMRTLIDPVYAAFALEQSPPEQRATLSGFYSVTWSIGFSIGPAIGGMLQRHVNLSASFVFGAICLVLSASLLLLSFGRRASNRRG